MTLLKNRLIGSTPGLVILTPRGRILSFILPLFLPPPRRGIWIPHQVRNDESARNDRSHIRRKRAASAKQTPPLSGREETSRPRKKGEDCLSAASSAAPEGGDSLRATKPDNSGGTSWFVLLAVEKNEHAGSPRTPMRGPVKCLLWVLPLPIFLDTAS